MLAFTLRGLRRGASPGCCRSGTTAASRRARSTSAQTIDILIIAVIGGLYRLEGAWVGALTYALLDNYSREWTPEIGNVLGPERFNTIIGVVFLVIVLLSPGGLVGLWERGRELVSAKTAGPPPGPVATAARSELTQATVHDEEEGVSEGHDSCWRW